MQLRSTNLFLCSPPATALSRRPLFGDVLGDAEVRELDGPARRREDVRGLQVPVDLGPGNEESGPKEEEPAKQPTLKASCSAVSKGGVASEYLFCESSSDHHDLQAQSGC